MLGHLEQAVAQEEQARAEPERRIGQPEVALQFGGGKADVDAVDVGDDVADEDERNQAHGDAPDRGLLERFRRGRHRRRNATTVPGSGLRIARFTGSRIDRFTGSGAWVISDVIHGDTSIGLGLRCVVCVRGSASRPRAEDGYDLWLRYVRVEDATLRAAYERALTTLVARADSPTERIVVAELSRATRGVIGTDLARDDSVAPSGTLVVGTPARSMVVQALAWDTRLGALGPEGYVIRSTTIGGRPATVIASTGEIGRSTAHSISSALCRLDARSTSLDIAERPRLNRRLLNHWDNLDGSIERGYAGGSLVEVGRSARARRSARDRLRARQRLARPQRQVVNSVNANPKSLSGDVSKEGRGAGRHVPAVRPYIAGANITTLADTLVAAVILGNADAVRVVLAEVIGVSVVTVLLLAVAYPLIRRGAIR